MHTFNFKPLSQIHRCLLIAAMVTLINFIWQGQSGFNIRDEGMLWYGAQQTLAGEIPTVDFLSYDPGRYYWSAMIMNFFNDNGLFTLRLATTLFQFLGLFLALILISKSVRKQDTIYAIACSLLLVIWFIPSHKSFDITASITLTTALFTMTVNKNNRAYFYCGLIIGLVAVFGRNHGFYGAVSSFILLLWMEITRQEKQQLFKVLSYWVAGIVAGYSPVMLLILLVPEYLQSLIESILFYFERKSTNLSLSVPWPWTINYSLPYYWLVKKLSLSFIYLYIFLFISFACIWLKFFTINNKSFSAAISVCSILGLFYAHHALSRADISHLAQGVFPILLGTLIVISYFQKPLKWLAFTVILFVSSLTVLDKNPGWKCAVLTQCINYEIQGKYFRIMPVTAKHLDLLNTLDDKYTPDNEMFLAVPFWPGAYAFLDRKSPVKYVFSILPRKNSFQHQELNRIKDAHLGFVLIIDIPPDNRRDLLYDKTNPVIYKYIITNFEKVDSFELERFQLYKPRQ